jgi:protein tyrosine phosphatase (PTP) superfamily phosphohydrolase (DUF442 family)
MNESALTSICNYLRISAVLATAGQPTPEQFPQIREAGYDTIINLALSTSDHAITHEPILVRQLGMQHIHLPVVWEAPTLGDLELFFRVMEANKTRKVFVHCAKNMRVSVFVYLYRVLKAHTSEAAALEDLHRIWQPNSIWQSFIDKALDHYGQVSNSPSS